MAFFVNFSLGGSATAADTAASTPEPSPFPVVASFINYLLGNQETQEVRSQTGSRFSWIHVFQIQTYSCFPAFLIHYLPQGAKKCEQLRSRYVAKRATGRHVAGWG